jgi:hypothetical protein
VLVAIAALAALFVGWAWLWVWARTTPTLTAVDDLIFATWVDAVVRETLSPWRKP